MPADPTNYLREWPDWRASPPRFPQGNATVPVTGISLGEARAFCSWAGGRLPSSLEWQAAAQAGDPSRIYPWSGGSGADSKGSHNTADEAGMMPPVVHRGRTPAPADSETLRAAANPLGLYDLVGNVWQYTDEFQDDHTRGVLLRGGSNYRPSGSGWYFPNQIELGTHNKYFLFDDIYERAATVGVRCVKDAA